MFTYPARSLYYDGNGSPEHRKLACACFIIDLFFAVCGSAVIKITETYALLLMPLPNPTSHSMWSRSISPSERINGDLGADEFRVTSQHLVSACHCFGWFSVSDRVMVRVLGSG